jgi:putative ABC transport system permease protein
MRLGDLWSLLFETLRMQRLRSFLTMLGIIIGTGSVVLLSSIGEGTREGILDMFSQFGSTIVGVQPGKVKTFGMGPGTMGGTTRPLTVEDGIALENLPGVVAVAPHVMGSGEVEAGSRSRRTYLYGTVADDQQALRWSPRSGSFLPGGDPGQVPAVCVLGTKVADDLFPGQNPLGAHVRIGGSRYVVAGVMATKGQMLGFDFDDMAIIPVKRAMRMFNRQDVNEIHVLASSRAMVPTVMASVRRVIRERHDGEDDITVMSQADALSIIDEILKVLTWGVLAIASISVLVGAIGILTIMWVGVHERTAEIGLIKALGASDRQVMLVFLAEAAFLSLLGGAAGILVGAGSGWLLEAVFPAVWVRTPAWIVPAMLAVSLGVGLAAGVIPALRAARLDPVEALRAE